MHAHENMQLAWRGNNGSTVSSNGMFLPPRIRALTVQNPRERDLTYLRSRSELKAELMIDTKQMGKGRSRRETWSCSMRREVGTGERKDGTDSS